jgi:hypothetical protein
MVVEGSAQTRLMVLAMAWEVARSLVRGLSLSLSLSLSPPSLTILTTAAA